MRKPTVNVLIFLLLLSMALTVGCAAEEPEDTDVLFQVSTLKALTQGVYDGEITLEELTANGDLGIGTFDGLDGEMVVLDGTVYQIPADGKAVEADSGMLTPFAAITPFEADTEAEFENIHDYETLKTALDALLESRNVFSAFRIDGTFSYIKTRSVPKQQEPYPLLSEVTASQPTFEFQNVKGTIVGFWCPEYAEGVNLPGYHLHFLSEDRTAGGHLLECALETATVQIDTTTEFRMLLPENEHFRTAGFDEVTEEEVNKVEK